MKKLSIDILADIIGGILIGMGTYNFAAAMNVPLGGFNGIALIFYKLFELPMGTVILVMNIPVAILCFKVLGRDFFIRSVRTIIITSLMLDYVAPLIPVYQGDMWLATICTGVLNGIGYALIYMRESSTGGLDFIIMSIRRYRPHMSIGNIAFMFTLCIVTLSTLLVSKQFEGMIYGLLISFIGNTVLDKIMSGVNSGKMALIVTDYPKEVAEYIDEKIRRGATFLKAEGSFSAEEKDVVMCACNNKEMYSIRGGIKHLDPQAFIIIVDSHEVVGEGFMTH